MSAYKQCSRCKEIKEMSVFYKDENMSNGLKNQCKECTNKTRAKAALGTRCCSRCKEVKPLSEFYKASNKAGLQTFCKSCSIAYYAQRQEKERAKSAALKTRGCTGPLIDNVLCQQFLRVNPQTLSVGSYAV